MRLFASTRSPFVRKVLLCAHELGLTDRISLVPTVVSFLKADDDVGRLNPLGQIPTLVADDGEAIYDSGVICSYLDGLGPRLMLHPDTPAAARACAVRQVAADGLMATFMRWYAERRRAADPLSPEIVAHCRAKFFRVADHWEAASPGWHGQAFDVGFAAIVCALSYADFRLAPEAWRTSRPALARWYAAQELRPSVAATVFREA